MMNKKGFLLGEFTLKIIIAVLSISLLVYLLFGLYGIYAGNKEVQEAKDTLKKVVELLRDSEKERTYILLEPKKSIFGFSEAPFGSCLNNCLCISWDKWFKEDSTICESVGKKIVMDKIDIKGPSSPVEIGIKDLGDKYEIVEK